MVKSSVIKLLISIVLVFSVLTVVTPTFAENNDANSTPVKNPETRKIAQERPDFRREVAASKSAVLKERLKNFRDKVKATIVERVSNNLNRINQNQTTQMKNHLERMSLILGSVRNRVSQSVPNSEVSAAISDSEMAISSASAAVNNQALNDYTLSISSETAAHPEAKEMRDKLHTDLMAVRQLVISAKQSVANAIRVAAANLGGRNGQ